MRARTTVVLLEPQLTNDEYTEDPEPDWSKPATAHTTPAAVEPASSDEQTLTAETIISRYVCRVPGGTAVTSSWRVRWAGFDHEIDGDVQLWENRRGSIYLEFILKRITG